ncbi:MAG: hypothetical protein Q9220_006253 [cf. Caloplaca sp. 1 TL-2023]
MPPPKSRIKLSIRRRATTPHDKVIEANALLSLGQPREAIELYTEVLYHDAPGHIIAFLNRSLAYAAFRLPQLAVADAYRAAISIHEMRNQKRRRARVRLYETQAYLKREKDCFDDGEKWTQPWRRHIHCPPEHWPKFGLASLLMDETSCPLKDERVPIALQGGPLDICDRLEVRAIFRLCGALYECSNGALQDAQSLLSDALMYYDLISVERKSLELLGVAITAQITERIDSFRPFQGLNGDEHTMLIPAPGGIVVKTAYTSALRSRVTHLPGYQYFADNYEPDLTKPGAREELGFLTAEASTSCSAYAVHQSFRGLQPDIELRAKKDLRPGEVLAWERNPWRVTTSNPETVLKSRSKSKAGSVRLYCDVCASVLLVPEGFITYLLDKKTHLSSSSPATKEPTAASSDQRNGDQRGVSPINGHCKQSNGDGTRYKDRKRFNEWCKSAGISICHEDHRVVYCSKVCRRHRRLFDPGLHENKIEQDLRNERFASDHHPRMNVGSDHPHSKYNHAKAQTLCDLLFLRIYAAALNSNQHPLEIVKFIRARLPTSDASLLETISSGRPWQESEISVVEWNFHNNVVRPISCINRFHMAHNQNHFEYLEQSDGWVINTLFIKIWRSTLMVRGALSAAIYDPKQKTKTRCHRGSHPWVSEGSDAIYDTLEDYDEVWAGALDILPNFIRPADESKGEKPNCYIKYDEGLWVIAGPPRKEGGDEDVVIKVGERLLRAPFPPLGGNPYTFEKPFEREYEAPSSAEGCDSDVRPGGPQGRDDEEELSKMMDSSSSDSSEEGEVDDTHDDTDEDSSGSDEVQAHVQKWKQQLRPPTPEPVEQDDTNNDADGDDNDDYDRKIQVLTLRAAKFKRQVRKLTQDQENDAGDGKVRETRSPSPGSSGSSSISGFGIESGKPPFRNGEEAREWYESYTRKAQAQKKKTNIRLSKSGESFRMDERLERERLKAMYEEAWTFWGKRGDCVARPVLPSVPGCSLSTRRRVPAGNGFSNIAASSTSREN